MRFFALGVNHTTAPVALREQVAFVADQLALALNEACTQCQLTDLVIVSTCNRTELYAMAREPSVVTQWLARSRQVDLAVLSPHLYIYQDQAAMNHLIRVCSGLDSMMLGEPQIFGQIKQALAVSRQAGTVTALLGRLFEQAFTAAKRVRSETAVGSQAVSLGYAVVQVARQLFADLQQTTALLVAAGDMNRLIGLHLVEQGVGRVLICNRSRARAEALAAELRAKAQVEVWDFDQLPGALIQADLVSSCTGSLYTVIDHPTVRQVMKKRRYHPQLLVDLAVPRDIDPAVAGLDEVYLYSIDDLQNVIAENLAQRRQAAVEAEVLVSQLAAAWSRDQQVRQIGPTIAQYRQQAEALRQQALDRALHSLAQGHPPEQVLQRLSQSLTARLIHAPSQLIRQAASAEPADILPFVVEQLVAPADTGAEPAPAEGPGPDAPWVP